MNKKVYFKTFGCRTNLFDTEIMRENLKDFNYTENENEADIIVVNSCSVTNGADAGARSYVRKVNSLGKKVIFAGCGIKNQGENLFKENLAFGVLGHSFKENLNDLLKENKRFFYKDSSENTSLDSAILKEFKGKARAFIKIQEGCNFICSYCIIPSVRGKARSYPLNKVIEQVKTILDSGVSEVVLTGTNVGSWGSDIDSEISALLNELIKLNDLKRIRIGSLESSQINNNFLDMLDSPKIERHLHIALQHTNNKMLEIMRRINRVESDMKLLEYLSSKGFAIGSDFIVGHPGESEEIWQNALNNLNNLPLTHIHPFVYSIRDNTHSAILVKELGSIKGDISKQRLHTLNNVIKKKNFNFRKNIKKPLQVLIEKKEDNKYYGLDEYFNRIVIESKLSLDNWIEISDYEVREEMNYAKI